MPVLPLCPWWCSLADQGSRLQQLQAEKAINQFVVRTKNGFFLKLLCSVSSNDGTETLQKQIIW